MLTVERIAEVQRVLELVVEARRAVQDLRETEPVGIVGDPRIWRLRSLEMQLREAERQVRGLYS